MNYPALIAVGILGLAGSSDLACQRTSVKLPRPNLKGMCVEEAIAERGSERGYSADSLSLGEVSQILFSAQGITGKRDGHELRAAPSAGGTFPIELYVVATRIKSLAPGIYHYLPADHAIELVRSGEYGDSLSLACLGQAMPHTAACSILMTAVPRRTRERYGERAMRYIYMEAGHISENIYLECTSLGLAVVGVGAFYDEELDALLGIDGETEMSVFVNCIGKREERGE